MKDPLEMAAALARVPPSPLKRARDVLACRRQEVSVPITTAEISAALKEVRAFVEDLPFVHRGQPILVHESMATHIAVLWALADAAVNNSSVEIVGS